MEQSQRKPRLIALLMQAHANQKTLVVGLGESERAAVGVAEQWSVKDHIAHITAWKQRQVLRLMAVARGDIPPAYEDVEQLNVATFEENRARPWTDVEADAERAAAELVARVEELSEEALFNPEHFPHQNGRPIWRSVLGNGYLHPQEHIARIHVERGAIDQATRIQEAVVENMHSLDPDPASHGVGFYNLACFYATTNQPVKALVVLPEALRLNPELVEWSRQDPDLESLRNDPRYGALYGG